MILVRSHHRLALFFVKAGAFTFGSGLAIVPFLHDGLVTQHHWLSERQFTDAVAMGLISPGPVVIMATFAGYLVHGAVEERPVQLMHVQQQDDDRGRLRLRRVEALALDQSGGGPGCGANADCHNKAGTRDSRGCGLSS